MNTTGPLAEETSQLLERVRQGDAAALNRLLDMHRPFMRRVVEARLDPRLHARIDPSDVVQEAQMEAARRIQDYLERRPMPFHLWLRQTAFENLLRLQRTHRADCRTVEKEFPLPDRSSVMLARQLLGESRGPPDQLIEAELARRVREGLAALSETDREILLMRSFEGLSNQEVAAALGIEPVAASQRFGRAVLRLRKLLTQIDPTEGGP
jgi:RNA polymerase sigma-70 factor (ECF subfamily)